jgi:hypothetical protein
MVGGQSSRAAAATAPAWLSYTANAQAAAVRVIAVEPGGPFAGPNDRIADLTAFAADAEANELGSKARAVAAFHGDEGVVPAARGVGPSKIDSTLAPTPLRGLPVEPPSALPLEAFSMYPSRPNDEKTAATARSVAGTGPGHAAGMVTSNGAAGVVRGSASSDLSGDGVLVATASTVVEGAAFGPVTIARVSSSVSVRQMAGQRVQRSATLDVAGVTIAGDALAVDRTTDTTVQGVRVRVIAAQDDDTGTAAPVLEVSLVLPQTLAGSGATQAIYRFGGAAAHVDGTPEALREQVSDPVITDTGATVTDMGVETLVEAAPPATTFLPVAGDQPVAEASARARGAATEPTASNSFPLVAIALILTFGSTGALIAVRRRRRLG